MTKKQVLYSILSLVILAALGYGALQVLWFFAQKVVQINPSVAAAIIGAMATVCVGLAAVIITQRQTKAREIEETHRAKKVEIYNDYLSIVTRIIKGLNDQFADEQPSEAELASSMVEYKRQILLWGSSKVIKAQLQYEASAATMGNTFLALDNLYRAIRNDIGLSNKGLAQFDLIKLFLKDAHLLDGFLRAGGKVPEDTDVENKSP